jgi:serine/threonine protein kinase
MPLSTGTRLGPYEIISAAGAGGMGEVYRARDTRLDRTVAIKVLPSHLSSDTELKQRFEREAKAISSLNHPHICTLHDVGAQDGIDFLVMEYLEGQTLADRLAKGRLPLDQALKIGVEIANALDKAHRQGITHRDLKPGNIMLTKTGAKLMDFGLAKPALKLGAAASPVTPATPTMDLASLTSAAISPMTLKGTIVGTFQYMAPEVLQGAEADARSDIFAFGCVLYEMITGRHAFEGKSQLSVMTAILEKEPEPMRTVVSTLPLELDRLVGSCLEKDPAQRLQSAHDIALQLAWVRESESNSGDSGGKGVSGRSPASRLGWIVAAILLLIVAVGSYLISRSWPHSQTLQASITVPDGMVTEVLGDTAAPATLSPDGAMIVLRGQTKSNPAGALWVRHLDGGVWQRLDGTEQAVFPFWSPDSRDIGFFTTDGKMCRIPSNGGSISQIAKAPVGKGGSWGQDGTIIYAPNFQSGIFRVSADGGTGVEITKVNRAVHTTHRWPQLMPDGKHFIYLAANHSGSTQQQNGIYFASIDGKVDRRLLTTDSNAVYSSGYLLFMLGSALQARRLDPASGKFTSDPITLNDNVQFDSSVWHGGFTASDNGLLLFSATGENGGAQLESLDRVGKGTPLPNFSTTVLEMHLSPDGRRLAVVVMPDIWIIDTERGTPTRLTFGGGIHFAPIWSPDGRRIAYGQAANGGVTSQFSFGVALHIMNADGSGHDEEVLPGDPAISLALMDWTKDGKYLLYSRGTGPSYSALWALPLFGDRKPFVVLTPPTESTSLAQGVISYDGRWLAYTSDESGRSEVYLTSFPKASGKIPVSSSGGLHPVWRRDGKELFFVNAGNSNLMAVDIKPGKDGIEVGQAHSLFSLVTSNHAWDARPDGQRFMVAVLPQSASKPMTLISNWTALLEKK